MLNFKKNPQLQTLVFLPLILSSFLHSLFFCQYSPFISLPSMCRTTSTNTTSPLRLVRRRRRSRRAGIPHPSRVCPRRHRLRHRASSNAARLIQIFRAISRQRLQIRLFGCGWKRRSFLLLPIRDDLIFQIYFLNLSIEWVWDFDKDMVDEGRAWWRWSVLARVIRM